MQTTRDIDAAQTYEICRPDAGFFGRMVSRRHNERTIRLVGEARLLEGLGLAHEEVRIAGLFCGVSCANATVRSASPLEEGASYLVARCNRYVCLLFEIVSEHVVLPNGRTFVLARGSDDRLYVDALVESRDGAARDPVSQSLHALLEHHDEGMEALTQALVERVRKRVPQRRVLAPDDTFSRLLVPRLVEGTDRARLEAILRAFPTTFYPAALCGDRGILLVLSYHIAERRYDAKLHQGLSEIQTPRIDRLRDALTRAAAHLAPDGLCNEETFFRHGLVRTDVYGSFTISEPSEATNWRQNIPAPSALERAGAQALLVAFHDEVRARNPSCTQAIACYLATIDQAPHLRENLS